MRINRKGFKTRIILVIAFILVISYGLFLITPFPNQDYISTKYPAKFIVDKESKFEKQGHNQCSAFTTAYVLRCSGIETNGSKVYKEISYKIPISGYVLPKGIINYLKDNNCKPQILKGNISTLKSRLTKGKPVIVLIGKGIRWQHYMTLVGYDDNKKKLYFFDSKRDKDENGALPGNRTLNEEYFLTLWNNGLPIYNKVYITVEL